MQQKNKTDIEAFSALQADIAEFVAPVQGLVVTDMQSSQAGIETLREIKGYQKHIEEKRKALVGPLNDQVKAINDFAKVVSRPLDEAGTFVQRQLNAFASKQEEIRMAAIRKVEAEKKKALEELEAKQKLDAETAKMFGVTEETQAVETAVVKAEFREKLWDAKDQNLKGTTKRWKVELVDIEKVPSNLVIKKLNESAALAIARATEGAEIPGLKFSQDISVTVSKNTRAPGY